MFLMGAWLTGSVLVAIVATQNFFTIDRLLDGSSHPAFRGAVERLGATQSRDFLRYLSSELNRLYFLLWNVAQIVIGGLVLASIIRSRASSRLHWTISLMSALVLVMTLALLPMITTIGRSLDFVPRDPPPAAARTFGLLHAAYTSLDLLKIVLGILATVWLGREQPERR
jgi:hypothetical protein